MPLSKTLALIKEYKMNELSKAQIALLATLIGWVLGQGAEIFRSKIKDRKIKKALLSELSDVSSKLKLNMELCERTLAAINGGMEGVTVFPQPILMPIYTNKYSDACMLFSSSQREGLNVAFSHILAINKRLESVSNKDPKTKLTEIYIDIIWAQEAIEYYFAHKGERQLRDDEEKLNKINDKFTSIIGMF